MRQHCQFELAGQAGLAENLARLPHLVAARISGTKQGSSLKLWTAKRRRGHHQRFLHLWWLCCFERPKAQLVCTSTPLWMRWCEGVCRWCRRSSCGCRAVQVFQIVKAKCCGPCHTRAARPPTDFSAQVRAKGKNGVTLFIRIRRFEKGLHLARSMSVFRVFWLGLGLDLSAKPVFLILSEEPRPLPFAPGSTGCEKTFFCSGRTGCPVQ